MANNRNEELERLLDGGDDASSATLFGTAIDSEHEKPKQQMSVQPVENLRVPGKSKKWIVLAAVAVIGGGVALIFSVSHLVMRPQPQVAIARKAQVPPITPLVMPATAVVAKPVTPVPVHIEEKLDSTDEIKRLAARSIAVESYAVTPPDTSRQVITKPVQKTPPVVATIKPKGGTNPAAVVAEKKDAIPTLTAAKVESTQKTSQEQPLTHTTPIEYAVGDKLPSGETILSVSKNGDVVTDMRIIKKGQN